MNTNWRQFSPGFFGADGIQWSRLLLTIGISWVVGVGIYLGCAYWFDVVYFRGRSNDRSAWKCQPKRDPDKRIARRDIVLGLSNLTMASFLSSLLAYHIQTGGYCSLRFELTWSNLPLLFVTPAFAFLLTDFALYWTHRMLHHRLLFRHIHRWHHINTVPTAYNTLSMHPVEQLIFQSMIVLPIFMVPMHFVGAIVVVLYVYWVGIADHCGIRLHSRLPWQSPTLFHDDHHVYFHVNYAHCMGFWDRIFGTWRLRGRKYGEHVYARLGESSGEEASNAHFERIDYSKAAEDAAFANGVRAR